MTQPSLSPRAWALMLALSLLWGSSFLVTTTLVGTMAPLHVVTWRVVLAAGLMWVWALARGWEVPRGARVWGAMALMGLGNNALPFTLQAFAQTTIESGLAGILNATTAIFGVVVAALFLADERLTRAKILGVVLGFGGVVLVMGPDALTGFDPRSLAQLAMLGSTLSYAFSSVWARKRLGGLRPEVATLGMLTTASAMMLPMSWIVSGPLPVALPGRTWVELIYYAAFVTAAAYMLYYTILRTAGAANTMLVTLIIVPTAVALGAVVRAESLPMAAYGGFALIAAGLVTIDGRLMARLRGR